MELSVIVSTYQRPWHLQRCLASLAAQHDATGRFEVIVVDDGSQDDTERTVARAAREAPFPVRFLTQPHEGYRLAHCRNAGIRAARAPYLLFTDGDCLFPADHVRRHLDARRLGVARAGDCFRLDERQSQQVDEHSARTGAYAASIQRDVRRFVRRGAAKAALDRALLRRDRPKLTGWNIAAWRDDLLRVNGFDQRFRGWGCEDDDLAARLRAAGVRIESALGYTHGYHLWHPIDPTAPRTWSEGANVAYLRRRLRLTRCLAGVAERKLDRSNVSVVVDDHRAAFARQMIDGSLTPMAEADLEIAFAAPTARFSQCADCRVLVCGAGEHPPRVLRRAAHAVIEVASWTDATPARQALERLLGLGPAPSVDAARSAAA